MALTGAMSAGISGLKTHMEALNVVGNNVANVNTYGYKAGRVTFKESIYSTQSAGSAGTDVVGSTNPKQTGYGCSIGTIDLDMSTKSLESTGIDTDCAIQGDGFFLVGTKTVDINSMDSVKGLSLSRVGNFEFRDGYLTDGQGNVVYGFVTAVLPGADGATSVPGTEPSETPSTALVPIRLPLKATGSDATVDPTDPNYIAPGTAVYPGVNADSGKNMYADDEGMPDTTIATTGEYIKVESLTIDENGCIKCVNGDTQEPVVIGYIALGSVENPGGLLHTDGPYYSAGDAAGDITVSAPGSSVQGSLNNGKIQIDDGTGNMITDPTTRLAAGSSTTLLTSFLEASGTDLATEFANMITYQRGYQANTRIITVTDTMLEELVNIKR